MQKSKKLGLSMSIALVVGNMIGSGIFLLPSSLASFGALSLWGWGVTSLGALLLAWVFSRLAAERPLAGGPYAYTREGFGDFAGFLMAWGYWISCWCTNAAIAVAMVSYIAHVFPVLQTNALVGASLSLITLWGLTYVNTRGVRKAGYVQLIATVLKILPLLAISLFGAFYFEPSFIAMPVASEDQSLGGQLSATVALTLWAFLGLESATIPADNVENPKQTIARATLIGTCIAAFIYIAATTVVMGLVPAEALQQSSAPFADAAKTLWGESAGIFIAIGAAISCFGALNGWILIQAQIPKAAADDKLFPSVFARLNKKEVPAYGLLISSGLATILILTNYHRGLVNLFTFIILLATLSSVIPYTFCAMTEWMRCLKQKSLNSKTKLNAAIAFLAFCYALWAVAGTGEETVYWGLMMLLTGVPVYAMRLIYNARKEG